MNEKTYTTFQVARFCDVYPSTVISWVKQNKIEAYATPGGHRRIRKSDLLEFLKKFKLPISDELREPSNRILIVEDEPAVGRMIKKALQRASSEFAVEWTQDGVGALLALAKDPPDLIILDVVMPVVDGARVLASLRADPATRGIKVVGITGKRLPPAKLQFMRRHTEAFYVKPFDIRLFTRRVLSLLGVSAELVK
ncbi:MAG: response regulator [Elusimicrobiota bacterium]